MVADMHGLPHPVASAGQRLPSVSEPVRYIGNKSKLIPFIRAALDDLKIGGGTACDPFSGTAAVARFLKNHGYAVTTSDIMSFSFALQWAHVVVDEAPSFHDLGDTVDIEGDPTSATLEYLNGLQPRHDFIYDHFCPEGHAGSEHERRYFTAENATHIDAARRQIHDWREAGRLDDDEYYILLTALIEAADRVANTTGVYAAYVKSWQPNATKPLRLRPPRLVTGTGLECRAYQRDAIDVVRQLGPFDLLYLDPPYNTRQYVGYYHIPEIIAEGWFEEPPRLRGKTGLPEDEEKRSDWSRRRRCETAFEQLVGAAECRHILMSYNSEGIISEDCIEHVLRERGNPDTYRRLEHDYKRYRADRDSETRRYKGDRVTEHLYYVRVT
jgi:adenine-specific DNA-methyltransferase